MKNIKITAILIATSFMVSCGDDFLSPVPNSVVSSEIFYQNDADLEAGLINMYEGIKGVNVLQDSDSDLLHGIQVEFYLTEMRSDNTKTKSSEGQAAEFEKFSITTTNGIVSDYYQSMYNVIFRANTVLKHIDVASDAKRGKIEGEAKFVRAYAHFNLVRLFGDVPLIESVITPEDNAMQFTRVDKQLIYDSIESDLLVAIEHLDNSFINRASKAAAQATLAKLYLTKGTNYLAAQQLCEAVIGSGYMLEPNFKDVFYNENNNEVIFSIGFIADNTFNSQNFSAEWLNAVGRTSGVNYVTNEAKAALDLLGGNRTPYSYRQDPGQATQNQVVKYLPNGDASLGIDPTSVDPTSAGNDWIVLRLADVYLMHVEAIMGTQQSTDVQAALDSFETVRLRAGLTADADGVITKQELLDERRVELAFENHRFFDLVRMGEAQNVLSNYSLDNDYSYTATDLLLPIPQREVNLSNGLLSQNPGY